MCICIFILYVVIFFVLQTKPYSKSKRVYVLLRYALRWKCCCNRFMMLVTEFMGAELVFCALLLRVICSFNELTDVFLGLTY